MSASVGDQHADLYDALVAAAAGDPGRFRIIPAADGGNFSPPFPGSALRLAGDAPPARPPRRILGLSAFYHDAAAALVIDGRTVAAAQEERFTRRRHDAGFPRQAAAWCLTAAGLDPEDIDLVAFYEEPFLKLDRLVRTLSASSPHSRTALDAAWLKAVHRQLTLPDVIRRAVGYGGAVCFVQHHLAHAASTFYPSGFEEAAVLVVDGVGEWATTSLAHAGADGIEVLEQVDFPHSLGLLYGSITAFLGFAVNSDEHKVMGLAAYGRPRYEAGLRRLLHLFPDGSFALDPACFPHARGARMAYDERLAEVLALAPRTPDAPISGAHQDLAASLQEILTESLTGLLRRLKARTGSRRLALAGGVALNGAATFRAVAGSKFERVFVQPAAGDAGGALGAALYAHHHFHETWSPAPAPFDPCLGPGFTEAEVHEFLEGRRVRHQCLPAQALPATVARWLDQGMVVGWLQGRMEFGPRALGARSILASPCDLRTRDRVNRSVKRREAFRPFGPVLAADAAGEYLAVDCAWSPLDYMLFVVPVRPERAPSIPAVVHVDGSTRPQLVYRERAPRLYALLRAFEARRGVPVLLNTSFNLAGDPIVRTPEEAYMTFQYSDLDVLVMERCAVTKTSH